MVVIQARVVADESHVSSSLESCLAGCLGWRCSSTQAASSSPLGPEHEHRSGDEEGDPDEGGQEAVEHPGMQQAGLPAAHHHGAQRGDGHGHRQRPPEEPQQRVHAFHRPQHACSRNTTPAASRHIHVFLSHLMRALRGPKCVDSTRAVLLIKSCERVCFNTNNLNAFFFAIAKHFICITNKLLRNMNKILRKICSQLGKDFFLAACERICL